MRSGIGGRSHRTNNDSIRLTGEEQSFGGAKGLSNAPSWTRSKSKTGPAKTKLSGNAARGDAC